MAKLAGIASLLLLIILLLIVNLIGKLLNLNEVEIMSIYYSNSGNLIVPIVTFMLGAKMGILCLCIYGTSNQFFLDTLQKCTQPRERIQSQKKFFPTLILLP